MNHYDNLSPTAAAESPDLVELERVYCLDWSRWTAENASDLERIFSLLPGGGRFVPEQRSNYWFGSDEERPPFLWASREPPGLQVYGVLTLSDWISWDRKFRRLGDSLPQRPVP